jgi:hypothetical protein
MKGIKMSESATVTTDKKKELLEKFNFIEWLKEFLKNLVNPTFSMLNPNFKNVVQQTQQNLETLGYANLVNSDSIDKNNKAIGVLTDFTEQVSEQTIEMYKNGTLVDKEQNEKLASASEGIKNVKDFLDWFNEKVELQSKLNTEKLTGYLKANICDGQPKEVTIGIINKYGHDLPAIRIRDINTNEVMGLMLAGEELEEYYPSDEVIENKSGVSTVRYPKVDDNVVAKIVKSFNEHQAEYFNVVKEEAGKEAQKMEQENGNFNFNPNIAPEEPAPSSVSEPATDVADNKEEATHLEDVDFEADDL